MEQCHWQHNNDDGDYSRVGLCIGLKSRSAEIWSGRNEELVNETAGMECQRRGKKGMEKKYKLWQWGGKQEGCDGNGTDKHGEVKRQGKAGVNGKKRRKQEQEAGGRAPSYTQAQEDGSGSK